MKIDSTGRIAYHSLRMVPDGLDFVQYDFDGSVESITPYSRHYIPQITKP